MRAKYFVTGVLLLTVGYLLGWSFAPAPATKTETRPAASPAVKSGGTETKIGRASVMLDFGDGLVRTYADADISAAKTVFDLMKNLSQSGNGFAFSHSPPGEFGVMVTQIGNKKNGEEGKYWIFWINNALAQVAADRASVAAGDVIEWKFINLKNETGI